MNRTTQGFTPKEKWQWAAKELKKLNVQDDTVSLISFQSTGLDYFEDDHVSAISNKSSLFHRRFSQASTASRFSRQSEVSQISRRSGRSNTETRSWQSLSISNWQVNLHRQENLEDYSKTKRIIYITFGLICLAYWIIDISMTESKKSTSQHILNQGSLEHLSNKLWIQGLELRTFHGHSNYQGDVFVKLEDDRIGIIADDNLGIHEAHVICNHLGFKQGARNITSTNHFLSNKSLATLPQVFIQSLSCHGNEKTLNDCLFQLEPQDDQDPILAIFEKFVSSKHSALGVVCITDEIEQYHCSRPSWKGDGHCDDINNDEDCLFDGGDCCPPNIDKTYCTECQCLEMTQDHDQDVQCLTDKMSNGYCEAVNNKVICGFDGGDCLDVLQGNCPLSSNFRDGFCDDLNNTPDCGYDGDDCCYGYKSNCQVCLCYKTDILNVSLVNTLDTFLNAGDVMAHYLFEQLPFDDTYMTMLKANVICKTMGYAKAIDYTKSSYFSSGLLENSSIQQIIQITDCHQGYEHIQQCQLFPVNFVVQMAKMPGVICSRNELEPVFQEQYFIELTNGTSSHGDLLVSNRRGKTGYICSEQWNIDTANTACRQLGFLKALGYTEQAKNDNKSSLPFVMHQVECQLTANVLQDCSYLALDIECPRGISGVFCLDDHLTWYSQDYFLLDDSKGVIGGHFGYLMGRNEEQKIGKVCANNWSDLESQIACQSLGFDHYQSWLAEPIDDPLKIAFDLIKCYENDFDLLFCNSVKDLGFCFSQTVVVLSCKNT